jgi:hypothetical protein
MVQILTSAQKRKKAIVPSPVNYVTKANISTVYTMKLGDIINTVFLSPPISPPRINNISKPSSEGFVLSKEDDTTYLIHSSTPSSPSTSEAGELDIKRFLLKVSETLDSDDVDLTTSPRDTADEEDGVLVDELALRRQVLWLYGTIAQREQEKDIQEADVLKEIEADAFKISQAKEVEDTVVDTPILEKTKNVLEDVQVSLSHHTADQEYVLANL